MAGGFGGDRLWFSPELRYHRTAKPDWKNLTGYHVPADTDPGHYQFLNEESDAVGLAAEGRLPFSNDSGYLNFSVERCIRMTAPPLALDVSVTSSAEIDKDVPRMAVVDKF